MNIVKVNVTRNRTVRALPITGNFLVREADGRFKWDQPNDSWTVFAPTGGNRQLITNIRHDDSDHSPDLFLYTNLRKNEHPSSGAEIGEDNRLYLDRTRKWFVRQFIPVDRVGVARFTGLPLNAFHFGWRRAFQMDELQIFGLTSGQMKVFVTAKEFNSEFNIFLKWQRLQDDMKAATTWTEHNRTKLQKSPIVMPWLHQHCRHGIVPFSDYDQMFVDMEEEVLFLADVA